MKILIIEDEKAVSNDLLSSIKMVWESKPKLNIFQVYSVKESINYLETEEIPDLIFSDIQLGDGTCFEIFRKTDIKSPVIFCTAYDEFAIQAFNSNGIDYILKPFITETIRKALDKYDNLRNLFSNNTSVSNYESMLQLLAEPREENRVTSILVYIKDKIFPIKLQDIALFFLEENDTYLLTLEGKKFFCNKSLDELEKITGNYFFRANRQILISRDIITSAHNFFSRKLALNLSIPFSPQIIVSKEKKTMFLDWLSQVTK